jgi:hypothetical protein
VTIKTPISSLVMSDGTTVLVPHGGLLAFVGPNNAGKSVSLRDIHSHLTQLNVPVRAVKSLAVDKEGSEEDLTRWLDEHCHKTFASGHELYSRAGVQVYSHQAVSWWATGPPYNNLGQFFTFLAGGEGRLAAANATSNINPLTDPPSHPLHSLYMNSELEDRISGISVKAFGVPLVLNRHAGNMIHLHVGQAPSAPHGVGAPPREYLEALSKMPRLDEQGDGMKSLMGLMLNIAASSYPLVLAPDGDFQFF